MTHDTYDMHGNANDDSVTSTPPDRAAAGDVSTTGVSSHETAAAGTHSAVTDHDADAAGAATGHSGDHAGGHGPDTSEAPTLVPTGWKELALPVVILLVVTILLWGPVTGAFQSRPAAPAPTPMPGMAPGGSQSGAPAGSVQKSPTTVASLSSPAGNPVSTVTSIPPFPSATTSAQVVQPIASPTETGAGAVPTAKISDIAPTQTAVAQAGAQGDVARVPVELNFDSTTFVVKAGDELLPDWTPETNAGIATWIQGTVANHILYVPYSDANAALFKNTKAGDKIDLTMNTGQVFVFAVTRSARAINGPADKDGEFSVPGAMSQDHAGVTLFLTGDPAPDRAVVQADFTGTIQQ